MREWYGAFPDWGPLAEDFATNTKLKRGQLNVCTVYVYCVWWTMAEICTRLAGNFCQYLTTVKSGAYNMVWLT